MTYEELDPVHRRACATDQMMTSEEVAHFLKISKRTLSNYVKRGLIARVCLPSAGTKMRPIQRFLKHDLMQFVRLHQALGAIPDIPLQPDDDGELPPF